MEVTAMFDAMLTATTTNEGTALEAHLVEWINERGNWICVDDLREAALADTDLVETEE